MEWRARYKPSPSFITLHLGFKKEIIPKGSHSHHLILDKREDKEKELLLKLQEQHQLNLIKSKNEIDKNRKEA